MEVRFTRFAAAQLRDVLAESDARHGPTAAERYRDRVETALEAVVADPGPASGGPDAVARDVLFHALRLARRRLPPENRVRRPPHVLVLRISGDGAALKVPGLAHERMLLGPVAKRPLDGADGE